jgi:hypothetical protein
LGKPPGWRPPQTWHFNVSSPKEGKQDTQYTYHKTKISQFLQRLKTTKCEQPFIQNLEFTMTTVKNSRLI